MNRKTALLLSLSFASAVFGSEGFLLDRQGDVISHRRLFYDLRKWPDVKLSQVSEPLKQAILLSEDQSFYSHHGVDWPALIYSGARSFIQPSFRRGASTLTMQWVGLENESHSGHRNWSQKLDQVHQALEAEKHFTKDEIFEKYLNRVDFRGEYRGIHSAARCVFQKHPSQVSPAEAAILAALIRSPNSGLKQVEARALQIQKKIDSNGGDPAQIQNAISRMRTSSGCTEPEDLAPALAQRLLNTDEPLLKTTLDSSLQRKVGEIVRRQLTSLKDENVKDAAVVVIENSSGRVLAYEAGKGVDLAFSKRQAGSILKPFFYAAAFESHLLSPSTLISDTAVEFVMDGGRIYSPENYDHRFHGDVSARVSLASSLNIPAVRVLDWVGVENSLEALKKVEIQPEIEKDGYYGPSLALGAIDVSLLDVTNAYRALANGGVVNSPILVEKKSPKSRNSHQAISNGTAFLISDILSDREARSLTFGLENSLATSFWSAVKTGTSKDMRDNWCVGYSSVYTVGVWVGNADGTPMQNVLGITGAGPIWSEVIRNLHEKTPSHSPVKPSQVLAVSGDYYLKGMPLEMRVAHSGKPQGTAKIKYPQAGMVFALDPEIPSELQKIWLESSVENRSDLSWEWNGRNLTEEQAREGIAMAGLRGKQKLKLISKVDHTVQDEIEFFLKAPREKSESVAR